MENQNNHEHHDHAEHAHPHAPHEAAPKSFLNALSPKQTFTIGLLGGFMGLCTIGFFVLLSMYLNGNMPTAAAGNNNAPVVVDPGTDDGGAPTAISLRPIDEKRDHIKGPKNAKITLVEYSDFECPFCQRFHPTVKQVMEKYSQDVRIVFRHFPLSFHPQAVPAANAAECASEQGKFWEMHDILFDQGVIESGSYTAYAKSIGLNTTKFDTCMKDKKYASRITEDQADGQNAGVQGTPHSVLLGPNGEKIPVSGAQPFEAIDSQIQALLQS